MESVYVERTEDDLPLLKKNRSKSEVQNHMCNYRWLVFRFKSTNNTMLTFK